MEVCEKLPYNLWWIKIQEEKEKSNRVQEEETKNIEEEIEKKKNWRWMNKFWGFSKSY